MSHLKPSLAGAWLLRLVLVVGLGLAALARAAEGPRQKFDVPAGEAEAMLKVFSEQSGRSVVFGTQIAKGAKTRQVLGEYTPAEALEGMLADTGLVAREDPKTGTFAVRRETALEAKNVERAIAESSQSVRPDRSGRIELDEKGEPVVKLDTFEVFGRKTLNMDIQRTRDDAQPNVVFNRQEIENSGAINLEEFFRQKLTSATTFRSNAQAQLQNFSSGANSSVSLRGLPDSQTLILVDGHRAAGVTLNAQSQQPDLNGIPMSAVERIEVLPSIAAGTYGGGATGGVINIILKRNYVGADVRVTYDNTFESDSAIRTIEFSSGFTLNNGSTRVMLLGSYADASFLLERDRGVLQKGVLKTANEVFTQPPGGYTSNILAVPVGGITPTLTLKSSGESLNSTFTSVPVGYTDNDGGVGLIANAGKYNFTLPNNAASNGALHPYAYAPVTKSFDLTVRHEFFRRLEGFVEYGESRVRNVTRTAPVAATFVVPASATINPFNQNVYVTTPILGADREMAVNLASRRLVAGFIANLTAQWKGEVDFSWTQTRFDGLRDSSVIDSSAASAAVTSGGVNVFKDTNAFPTNFSPFLNSAMTLSVSPVATALRELVGRAGGPLYEMTSGPINLSFSVGRREERTGDQFSQNGPTTVLNASTRREVIDAYAEVTIPLLSRKHSRWVLPIDLELQAAGRFEDYTTIGAQNAQPLPLVAPIRKATNKFDEFTPTLAVKLSPFDGISFRASYSEGFLPPGVGQLVQTQQQVVASTNFLYRSLRDPKRGNEPLGLITILNVGNPALKPELSRSMSAGVILEHAWKNWSGRLSADYVRIEKFDEINAISFALGRNSLTLEDAVPGLIQRGPVPSGDPYGVGPIAVLDSSLRNFSRSNYDSLDLSLDLKRTSEHWGDIQLTVAATRLYHCQQQITPVAPIQENMGFSGNVPWRVNSTLTWSSRTWTVGWTGYYYAPTWINSNHSFDNLQGAAQYPSQVTHDVFVGYRRADSGGRVVNQLIGKSEFRLGVRNILNREPTVRAGGSALPFIDPRMASYYLSWKRSF